MNHEKSPVVSTYWKKYAIFSFTLIEVIRWAFQDCITCICIVCKDLIGVEYTVHVINVITINVFVSYLFIQLHAQEPVTPPSKASQILLEG